MSSRLLTIVLLLAVSSAAAEPRVITGATVLDGTSPTARMDDAVIVIDADRYDYEAATRDLNDHPDRAHRSFLCSGIDRTPVIRAMRDVGSPLPRS